MTANIVLFLTNQIEDVLLAIIIVNTITLIRISLNKIQAKKNFILTDQLLLSGKMENENSAISFTLKSLLIIRYLHK